MSSQRHQEVMLYQIGDLQYWSTGDRNWLRRYDCRYECDDGSCNLRAMRGFAALDDGLALARRAMEEIRLTSSIDPLRQAIELVDSRFDLIWQAAVSKFLEQHHQKLAERQRALEALIAAGFPPDDAFELLWSDGSSNE